MNDTWREAAVCASVGTEPFFPEKGASAREARAVCAVCPVRAACLRYAIEHDERHGIWGGLTEHQRRRLRERHLVSLPGGREPAAAGKEQHERKRCVA